MSFVDLMSNVVWSDADIRSRTEAELASNFPFIEILKRKVTGMMLGQYQLTPEEQQEFGAYAAASFQSGQRADEARADMVLLLQVLAHEAALARLQVPPIELAEDGSNADAFQLDDAERALADTTIGLASQEVLGLVVQRNPPPAEPAPEQGLA